MDGSSSALTTSPPSGGLAGLRVVLDDEGEVELMELQGRVKDTGGGGAIERSTEHHEPCGARIVALEEPSERERTQWCSRRHVAHLSGAEQRTRFLIRQIDPVRQWKPSPPDLASPSGPLSSAG